MKRAVTGAHAWLQQAKAKFSAGDKTRATTPTLARKLILAAASLVPIATAVEAETKPGLTMYENCAAFHYIIHEKTQWDEATAQKNATLSDIFLKIAAMERERIGDSAENTLPQVSKQIDAFYTRMGKNYDETGHLWGKDPFFVELLQACADFLKTLENQ